MTKNPVRTGVISVYETDWGADLIQQVRYKFVGEPDDDQDGSMPRVLGNFKCFEEDNDAVARCQPKKNPLDPRNFVLTFPNAVHKMPVASRDCNDIIQCGRDALNLPNLICLGYDGESVKNIHLYIPGTANSGG